MASLNMRDQQSGSAHSQRRIERKFVLPLGDVVSVRHGLDTHATRQRFAESGTSRIISFYYESFASRRIGSLSIRMRSYLDSGYEIESCAATLDAKFEDDLGAQTKLRRDFGNWVEAERAMPAILSAHLPAVLVPQLDLQALRPVFGVEYQREYFHCGDVRFTLDHGVSVLEGQRTGLRSRPLSHAILEVKSQRACTEDHHTDALMAALGLAERPVSPSKRSMARQLLNTQEPFYA